VKEVRDMAIGTVKTGISLPRDEFVMLERLRVKRGLSRSELFRQALLYWVKAIQEGKQVRQYVEGYKRHPERVSEIKAMEIAASEAFEEEELK
jgi:metal-responsive CopG/Arc/MetJ family transcriptional regulator